MSKMFRKKNNSSSNTGVNSSASPSKMTPLTIAGVAERGQCVKCANGKHSEGAGQVANTASGGNAVAVLVPTVKAVPVVIPSVAAPIPNHSAPPQSKFEVQADKKNMSNGDNHGNLKQPPEDLLGLNPNKAAASGNSRSSSVTSGSRTGTASASTGQNLSTESEDSDSEDDGSLEDVPLLNFDLCRLESDHGSSSVVNNLRRNDTSTSGGTEGIVGEEDMDDRKPAAKPTSNNGGGGKISQQIEESAERIRKLRSEAAAIDMAFLESCPSKQQDDATKLECPPGMSPEVFYQLPPEVQKEVIEQGSSPCTNSQKNDSGKGGDDTTATADIDLETLASLPDNIRKEVLEQARREQQSKNAADISAIRAASPPDRKLERQISQLSKSTTAFLSEYDMSADDYENFPEELKNDIMEQRRRRSSEYGNTMEDIPDDENFDLSGYDPETLASLPEDVRKEVLDEERRQREKRREKDNIKPSVVGAHSVNVPAGYDPDTFSALPEDVQQELMDDAARQRSHPAEDYSAEGYDYESIADARVVQARLSGTATSCTYTGEYNTMGKRQGDGELKWANGDKYVGKFKGGFIEGRGTISFHDGTEYAGQWKANRFHGEGTRRFNNGNVYTGNYGSGKRQGQGRCYFANGDMYVGDWKDDTIHGFGRYYYNNGHSFEGMFRNGKRNGRGKYQLTDGRVEIYRYVNDSRAGDGVRWSANRKKAWRMNDGKVTKKVSIENAAAIAKRCGPVLEET